MMKNDKKAQDEVLDDETQVEPIYDNAPSVEVSYEALEETIDGDPEEEALQNIIDTKHTDGSTTDPFVASEQGMVYTPPSDPPVLPSDDLQGAEVATGFAQSMEESNPDVEDLPARVDNQDLDLEEDVRVSLHNNSETGNLENVRVRVRNGVVLLAGTVFSEDDIGIVEEQIRDLDGVVEVVNGLTVAAERA
ncbi:MAG: BON domain-containing protein [Caldilineaceae bacterium]|nr:BON domain-containing protein [Caldilineaceae bacterium]